MMCFRTECEQSDGCRPCCRPCRCCCCCCCRCEKGSCGPNGTCDGSCGCEHGCDGHGNCKPAPGGNDCGPNGTCDGSCGCEHGCDGHGNCKPAPGGDDCGPNGTCDGSCGCEHGCDGHGNCKPAPGGDDCGPNGTCNGSCGCQHGCDGHGNCNEGSDYDYRGNGSCNITLLDGIGNKDNLHGLVATEDGYIACGTISRADGDNGLLIKFDQDLKVQSKTSIGHPGRRTPLMAVTKAKDQGYLAVGCTNTGTATQENYNYFIVALDNDLKVTQQRHAGGSFNNHLYAVHSTPVGFEGSASAVAAGSMQSTSGTSKYTQPFIVTYDKNCNILKQACLTDPVIDGSFQGVVANKDGFVAVGYAVLSDGFDKRHGLIATFDHDLKLRKQTLIGGAELDYLGSIAKTSTGYVAVGYIARADLSDQSIWVVTFDEDLNLIQKQLISGNGNEQCTSVTVAPNGNYVLTGTTTSIGAGGNDNFLIILNKDLNIVRELVFGGEMDESANAVAIGADGSYAVTGTTLSVGISTHDPFIAVFKGELNELTGNMPKYPDLRINAAPRFKKTQDFIFTVNNSALTASLVDFPSANPNYTPNYNPAITVDSKAVDTTPSVPVDGSVAKDGRSDSNLVADNGESKADITLFSGEDNTNTNFTDLIATENGYIACGSINYLAANGGLIGGDSLLVKCDLDLKVLNKTVIIGRADYSDSLQSVTPAKNGGYLAVGKVGSTMAGNRFFIVSLDNDLKIIKHHYAGSGGMNISDYLCAVRATPKGFKGSASAVAVGYTQSHSGRKQTQPFIVTYDKNCNTLRQSCLINNVPAQYINGDFKGVVANKDGFVAVGCASAPSITGLIAVFDDNLNLRKQVFIGRSNSDYLTTIAKTNTGYVTGGYSTSVGGAFSGDIWIMTFDEDLNLVKKTLIEGAKRGQLTSIAVAPNGNYVLTGTTTSTGTGVTNNFLIVLDQNLNILKQLVFGGYTNENANAVVIDADGRYAVAGVSGSAGASRLNALIANFRGDLDELASDMAKYTSLVIDTAPDFKSTQDFSIGVDNSPVLTTELVHFTSTNPNYTPNYNPAITADSKAVPATPSVPGDGSVAKDGRNDSSLVADSGAGKANITLIGSTSSGNHFMDLIATENGYVACGTNGLLAQFDLDVKILNKVSIGNAPDFQSITPAKNGGYLAVGHTRTASGYKSFIVALNNDFIVVQQHHSDNNSSQELLNAVRATPKNFEGAASAVAVGYSIYNASAYQPSIVTYDKDCNILRQSCITSIVSGGQLMGVVANKDGFVAVGHASAIGGAGSYDGLIVSFDEDLNLRKQILIGGTSLDYLTSIVKTSTGYVTCGYSHSLTQGFGKEDIWVIVLDEDLNIVKKALIGGPEPERLRSIAVDSNGNYVLTGLTSSFGSVGLSSFLIILNQDLSIRKQLVFGGTDNDYSEAVVINADGSYVVAGAIGSAGVSARDALIATFKGDLSGLTGKIAKYPSLTINAAPGFKSTQECTFTVNNNPGLTASLISCGNINTHYKPDYNVPLTVDTKAVPGK